ncbi:MAG: hypothetical protein C4K49_02035 [Candidatus Thorarchaeota archaeon]|nr:MAG: hypothetical protein C4K49_02035 [Candidatus Thorarchaeota archaeon]
MFRSVSRFRFLSVPFIVHPIRYMNHTPLAPNTLDAGRYLSVMRTSVMTTVQTTRASERTAREKLLS